MSNVLSPGRMATGGSCRVSRLPKLICAVAVIGCLARLTTVTRAICISGSLRRNNTVGSTLRISSDFGVDCDAPFFENSSPKAVAEARRQAKYVVICASRNGMSESPSRPSQLAVSEHAGTCSNGQNKGMRIAIVPKKCLGVTFRIVLIQ